MDQISWFQQRFVLTHVAHSLAGLCSYPSIQEKKLGQENSFGYFVHKHPIFTKELN